MICENCAHENPQHAKFCLECGHPFPRVCSRCIAQLPRDANFCLQCGEAVPGGSAPSTRQAATSTVQEEALSTTESVAGERRQLTVMFCDLVGWTALGQRLDAEELREVVTEYQAACAKAVGRFDGHIAQYLGDGVLVYFGWPAAHEEDPERAVRAALAIQRGLAAGPAERRVRARIGIHTGSVVVGEIGGGARRETLAVGDTTNIAARIQRVAEPGTTVISDHTLRLVQGLFVTRDLGAHSIQGITEPIRVHEVGQASGVRSRLDVAERLTPLVGREQELGSLLARWQLAEEGSGQVVLLSGEAGLGKSRLLRAFRERLSGEAHTWLEVRCTSLTSGDAFWPVLEILSRGLAYNDSDTPREQTARLERVMDSVGNVDAAQVVPYLASLLGLPESKRYPLHQMSAEVQREKTLDALSLPTFAIAEQQPVVYVCEDLHWSDPSTLELMGRMIDQIPTLPLLLILSHRPDFEPPWLPSRSHLAHLSLGRLTASQTAQMAEASVGGRLPELLLEQITARADGVPLFVEELARSVVDSGLVEKRSGHFELCGPVSELEIPTTLQALLMARLDRLSAAKQVAQLAATLGREFPYALIERASTVEVPALRNGLQQLVAAEVLYQRGMPPDSTYLFKHTLVQDTAYQTQLKASRRALHARIAGVLEEHFQDRVAAEPSEMAWHCSEGGLIDKAVASFQLAGQQAQTRLANTEAVEYLRRALEFLARCPEDAARHSQEIELQLALGGSLVTLAGFADEGVVEAYRRVEELSHLIGEGPQQLPALIGLATHYMQRGDTLKSHEFGASLHRIAERLGQPLLRIIGHVWLGTSRLTSGSMEGAIDHLERALTLAEKTEIPTPKAAYEVDLQVLAYADHAIAMASVLRVEESYQSADAGLQRARELGHVSTLGLSRALGVVQAQLLKDHPRAREWAGEAIELVAGLGFHGYESIARVHQGWAEVMAGESAGARELTAGIAIAEKTGSMAGLGELYFCAAEAFCKLGDGEIAQSLLDRASAVIARTGEISYEGAIKVGRAELLGLAGSQADLEEAWQLAHAAIDDTRKVGSLAWELRAGICAAQLSLRLGGDPSMRRARKRSAHDHLVGLCRGFAAQSGVPTVREAQGLLERLA